MSLTAQDLHAIRLIVQDETRGIIQAETRPIIQDELRLEIAPVSVKLTNLSGEISSIDGRLEALENDIKDIYQMLKDMKGSTISDKDFSKLPPKERVLRLNAELLRVAKDLKITLPGR